MFNKSILMVNNSNVKLQDTTCLLSIMALSSFGFTYIRDKIAAGIPDRYSIPLWIYPGFASSDLTYSGQLLDFGELTLLFVLSSLFVLGLGFCTSIFMKQRKDITLAILAVAVWILTTSVNGVSLDYHMRGEGRMSIAGQLCSLILGFKAVIFGVLLVVAGACVGEIVKKLCYFKCVFYSSEGDWGNGLSRFCSLIYLLCFFRVVFPVSYGLIGIDSNVIISCLSIIAGCILGMRAGVELDRKNITKLIANSCFGFVLVITSLSVWRAFDFVLFRASLNLMLMLGASVLVFVVCVLLRFVKKRF